MIGDKREFKYLVSLTMIRMSWTCEQLDTAVGIKDIGIDFIARYCCSFSRVSIRTPVESTTASHPIENSSSMPKFLAIV